MLVGTFQFFTTGRNKLNFSSRLKRSSESNWKDKDFRRKSTIMMLWKWCLWVSNSISVFIVGFEIFTFKQKRTVD